MDEESQMDPSIITDMFDQGVSNTCPVSSITTETIIIRLSETNIHVYMSSLGPTYEWSGTNI